MDTIAAIATTVGVSALNVIKISGTDSIKIVNRIFKGKNLLKVNSHTINYGFIIDKNDVVDEVLVSVFKAPKSFTRENMVEINCHGGIVTTNKILELLLINGIRLAEPGEFLKRAFLNGRIDLIKAESVSDLINAETENARKIGIKGIKGEISNLINNLREEVLNLIANIEVNIDYPEYEDAIIVTNKLIKEKNKVIKDKLSKILNESNNGLLIKNGIKVAIIGKPNVGKSSLLNMLIEEEKAIVTEVEGTTRDIVEGKIMVNGIELKLIDTAGIRSSSNIVEKLGIQKSREVMSSADLVLLVLDNNKKLSEEDKQLLKAVDKKNTIIVINKIDLKNELDRNILENYNVVEISTITEEGKNKLKEKISEMFSLEKINSSDFTYLSNARQIALIKECINISKDIDISLKNNDPVDLIETNIKILWNKLGEIIGETYKEELLDEIFSKFCLGK